MIEPPDQKIVIETGAGSTIVSFSASRYYSLSDIYLKLKPYIPSNKKSPKLMLGNTTLSEQNWNLVTDQCNDIIIDKSYGEDIILTVGFTQDNFNISDHNLFRRNRKYCSTFSYDKYFFYYENEYGNNTGTVKVFDCFKNKEIYHKICDRVMWSSRGKFNTYINRKGRTVVWLNIFNEHDTKILSFDTTNTSLIETSRTIVLDNSQISYTSVGCNKYLYCQSLSKTCNRINVETGESSIWLIANESFYFMDVYSDRYIAIITSTRAAVMLYDTTINKLITTIKLKKIVKNNRPIYIDQCKIVLHNKIPYLIVSYFDQSFLKYINMISLQTNTVEFHQPITWRDPIIHVNHNYTNNYHVNATKIILLDFDNKTINIYKINENFANVYIRGKFYQLKHGGIININPAILGIYPMRL